MWWQEHWVELGAIVAFVAQWADVRSQVKGLKEQVARQNGRIGKLERRDAWRDGFTEGEREGA